MCVPLCVCSYILSFSKHSEHLLCVRPVLGAGEIVVSKTGMVSTLGDLTILEEDDSKQITQRKTITYHQTFATTASCAWGSQGSRHVWNKSTRRWARNRDEGVSSWNPGWGTGKGGDW